MLYIYNYTLCWQSEYSYEITVIDDTRSMLTTYLSEPFDPLQVTRTRLKRVVRVSPGTAWGMASCPKKNPPLMNSTSYIF
jgi:hypothetical protein